MLIESIFKTFYHFTKFIETELLNYNLKGLTYSHFEILRILKNNKTLNFKQISQSIFKHKSTVTTLIDKLKVLGYVEISKAKKDKRMCYVCLTDKGKYISPILKSIEQKTDLQFIRKLTPIEQETLKHYLKKLLIKI